MTLLVVLASGGFAWSQDLPAADNPIEVVSSWFPKDLADRLSSRVSGWLPVYLELRTDRDRPQRIRLAGTVSHSDNEIYRTETRLEVNPGATQRLWIYLRYEIPSREAAALEAKIEFFPGDAGDAFYEQRLPFSLFEEGNDNGILVSGDGVKHRDWSSPWTRDFNKKELAWSGQTIAPGDNEWGVSERCLPDDPLGYHRVNALILRNFDETKMERSQVEAIRDWVYLGGTVILVPERKGEIFATRLVKMLLPEGSVGEIRGEEDFEPGLIMPPQDYADDSEMMVPFELPTKPGQKKSKTKRWKGKFLRIDPVTLKGDRELHAYDLPRERGDEKRLDLSTGRRVYHEHIFGSGRVGILTIDDQAHVGAVSVSDPSEAFRRELWYQILAPVLRGSGGRWHQRVAKFEDRALHDALRHGLSADLGLWFIAGLVLFYLVLVGPGLYFVLKRRNRLQWVVWLEPLIVVVYVGLIFFTGYMTRGVLNRARTVTLYHWKMGEPLLQKESFLGIFSSDESHYRVTAVGAQWLRPAFSNPEEASSIRLLRHLDGSATGPSIDGFRLDIWQTGVFAAMSVEEMNGTFEISKVAASAAREPGDGDDDLDVPEGATGDEAPQTRTRTFRIRNSTPFTIAQGFVVEAGRSALYSVGRIEIGADGLVEAQSLFRLFDFKRQDGDRDDPAAEDEEVERPLPDDRLTADAIYRLLEGGSGLGSRRDVRFVGVLDRGSDVDFEIDRGATMEDRADLFVVYK